MTPAEGLQGQLDRWERAGLITSGQAGSIRAYEERRGARAPEPPPPAPAPPPPAGRPPAGRGPALSAPAPGLDLRTLGVLLAALALISLLGSIFSVWTDLIVGPGTRTAAELEDILHLVAGVCGLVGGLRLAAWRASGRGLVYWSLGINLVATLLLGHDRLAHPFTVLTLATWVALLLLTWRLHFVRN